MLHGNCTGDHKSARRGHWAIQRRYHTPYLAGGGTFGKHSLLTNEIPLQIFQNNVQGVAGEEAFMTVGAIASQLDKGFEKYMAAFHPYLIQVCLDLRCLERIQARPPSLTITTIIPPDLTLSLSRDCATTRSGRYARQLLAPQGTSAAHWRSRYIPTAMQSFSAFLTTYAIQMCAISVLKLFLTFVNSVEPPSEAERARGVWRHSARNWGQF